ncbi:MAG: lipopolysaccharide biosynthesis protein [Nitrospirota bacterium]|jgi:O-antigen/teichoic acid export membrane protein
MSGRLARNAVANVLQTLAGAGLLFALYRYINKTLGVEQLGVWSVVLATVSASRLADMGLSTGVIRFVARDRARGELDRASRVIDTANLTLMASVGAVLPLLHPLLAKLLPHLFDAVHLVQAQEILPYALVSLWLTIIATVYQGGLDGCQRMELRAGLVVAGQALLLAFAFWLVPRYGLVGLAWAQIAQGLFLSVTGRLLLRRALPHLPWLPRRWCWGVLREMLGYGASIQLTTLFMLLFDPVAKALLARFGGPAAAGYFEMANQVVLKARAVIVTGNQAVVPHVAVLAESEPARLARLYRQNVRVLVFITLPAFALLFAWAGAFSWLLAGTYQREFVFLLGLLVLAWGGNIFDAPAYFTNMGTGHVGWNTLSHVIMGALNASLGWLLGSWYGAHGVAFAYAIALVTGSLVLIAVFQRRHGLGWRGGLAREHLGLVVACAVVVAFGWIEPLRPSTSRPAVLAAGLLLPPLVLGLAAWFHPMRRQLLGWLMAREART